MKLILGKLFIAFNLYVVALNSSALEVNLSPASLYAGAFGGVAHGNVMFGIADGQIKIGPTFGGGYYGEAIATGLRVEFYLGVPENENESEGYISLGAFMLSGYKDIRDDEYIYIFQVGVIIKDIGIFLVGIIIQSLDMVWLFI